MHFDTCTKMTYHSNQATFNIVACLEEIDMSFFSHFLFQSPEAICFQKKVKEEKCWLQHHSDFKPKIISALDSRKYFLTNEMLRLVHLL